VRENKGRGGEMRRRDRKKRRCKRNDGIVREDDLTRWEKVEEPERGG